MFLPRRPSRAAAAACALFCLFSLCAAPSNAQTSVQPGQVLISELRLRGPAGSTDEFVELYNNTDQEIIVQASDRTSGWAVFLSFTIPTGSGLVNAPLFVIPNGTRIPARGHILAAHSTGYSLGGYPSGDPAPDPAPPPAGEPSEVGTDAPDVVAAEGTPFSTATPDFTWNVDVPDGAGLALYTTAGAVGQNDSRRLDAFGFTTSPAGFREGAGWPAVPTTAREASFVRKQPTDLHQDTNDNAADFNYPGTSPDPSGDLLGAPGPQNLLSPVLRRDVRTRLLDPNVASTQAPNRERSPAPVPNGNLGTLTIRRTFTNETGWDVTRLRFRVIDITTLGAENTCGAGVTCADVRALSSSDGQANVGGQLVPVRGVRLEEPPAQPLGGGFNSSLSADFITLSTPLKPGESVNLQFVVGVMRSGPFRFFVSLEASVNEPIIIPPTAIQN